MESLLRWYYAGFRASVLLVSRLFGPSSTIPPYIPQKFGTSSFPNPDRWAKLLFLPSEHNHTGFHIVVIMRLKDNYWMVDAGAKLAVMPLSEDLVPRLISTLKPRYIVQCDVAFTSKGMPMLPEPYSCVTITRSLIGMDAPLVHTPEQLINKLWENSTWAESLTL